MRRQLVGLLLVANLLGGCPARVDTDTSAETDTDTDAQSCPGAIDQERYIEEVLPEVCAWFMTCADNRHETVEDCIGVFARNFRRSPCWDECRAAECAAWIQDPPTCSDSRQDTLQACNEVKTCPD